MTDRFALKEHLRLTGVAIDLTDVRGDPGRT